MSHTTMQEYSIRCLTPLLLMVLAAAAMPLAADDTVQEKTREKAEPVMLDVYKSPTCGCCKVWIDHLEERGFRTKIHHPADMDRVKKAYGVSPRYRSCHTAVSEDGYIFEGHIPAHIIKRFLDDSPEDAIGLTVPGMPVGSPGMESGDRFMPYQVLLIRESGAPEVYAEVRNREDQYQE